MQSISVALSLNQPRRQAFRGSLVLQARSMTGNSVTLAEVKIPVSFSTEATEVTVPYSIPNPHLWDEFNPKLYTLMARLVDDQGQMVSEMIVTFGMREISVSGTRMAMNGRLIFLRGDVDCATFPLTGYPLTGPFHKSRD